MATISEKLQLALDNKAKIKAAIEEKGGTITGDMSTWGETIKGLKTGGGLEPIKCTYNVTTTSKSTSIFSNSKTSWISDIVFNFKVNGVETYPRVSSTFQSLGNNDVEFRSVAIQQNLFHNCTSLTSITIPDSVIEIGGGAFEYCSNLTDITLPTGLRRIGNNAFSRCTSILSFTIPDSVTEIGESVFHCCTRLENLTIGNGVTEITPGLFEECINLRSIIIPESVENINNRAFLNCECLSSVTIYDTTNLLDYYGNTAYRVFERIAKKGNLYFIQKAGLEPSNELLKYFGGWELYINGEHIGTIENVDGYYY